MTVGAAGISLRPARGGSWLNSDQFFPQGANRLPWASIEAQLPEGVRCTRQPCTP